MLYCLGLPPPAPNPLFPACAGIRPRAGGVSNRSAIERANTAAENPRLSGLSRNRLAPDGPAGAMDQVHTGEPNLTNELVAQIHPRMPVILPEQHHAAWLG